MTFETGPSAITATITNPNEQGYCYATIGIGGGGGPYDHSGTVHIFGDDHDSDWPGARETTTLTHAGLENDTYRIHGYCGPSENSTSQSDRAEYTVTVGPDEDESSEAGPAGSLANLSTLFGS